MEKIIKSTKNTIEDFTDDKELIEIEKLILDKKYEEALERIKAYSERYEHKWQKEKNCKYCIKNIMLVICIQYTNLSVAIYDLILLNEVHDWESLGLSFFLVDILQKMEKGYYEKLQTEMANEYIARSGLTLKYMKIKILNKIPKVLKESKKNPLDWNWSKEESITKYLFNKFQK
jgi:hypothetical protein